MSRFVFLFLYAALLIGGCHSRTVKTNLPIKDRVQADSIFVPEYARGFKISYFPDYKIVEVFDPWGVGTHLGKYLLGGGVDLVCSEGMTSIDVPVEKWVPFSSTQVSFAEKLEVIDQITGVAEPKYISHPRILKGIEAGEIVTVGLASAPDLEMLQQVSPGMVMVSPFKDASFGGIKNVGLNVVVNASYMESSPLARAEWLVFMGAFFNKELDGRRLFQQVEKRYLEVVNKTKNLVPKPSVFSEKLYQGVWYVPSKQSYMARFFKDAGACYVFDYLEGTGAKAFDFEAVYAKAEKADFWVIKGNRPRGFSYSMLYSTDERYVDFEAFKRRKIIFSNTHCSKYFEKGVLEPDVVVTDLAAVFHPEEFKEHVPVYFKLLPE